ncbi:MAG: hypothetical protein ABW221_14675 [Vicinamibacteria bacterium]
MTKTFTIPENWKRTAARRVLTALAPMALALLAAPQASALTVKSHTCNLTGVELQVSTPNDNRLLAICDAPATGSGGASVWYFALDTTANSNQARLTVSMLTAARVAGRPVTFYYYSDDSTTNNWGMGCNPNDCRPMRRVSF